MRFQLESISWAFSIVDRYREISDGCLARENRRSNLLNDLLELNRDRCKLTENNLAQHLTEITNNFKPVYATLDRIEKQYNEIDKPIDLTSEPDDDATNKTTTGKLETDSNYFSETHSK